MKHNTHIYLAMKAIEFTRDGVDNMLHFSGKKLRSTTLRRKKAGAKAISLRHVLDKKSRPQE